VNDCYQFTCSVLPVYTAANRDEYQKQKNKEEFDFVFLRSVRRLLVTASVVPSSPILLTVMKGGAKFL
jgi:hypothetical protein